MIEKKRFKVFSNYYRVNKLLARWIFGLMLVLILPQFVWSVGNGLFGDGWLSVECVPDEFRGGTCFNPYFVKCTVNDRFASRNVDLCLYEHLPPGFVYNPLPWFYDLYQFPVMGLFLFGAIFNHFKYNKHKSWFN